MKLSADTLTLCLQALGAVPATNANQASRLAAALIELEAAMSEIVASELDESPNGQVKEESVR